MLPIDRGDCSIVPIQIWLRPEIFPVFTEDRPNVLPKEQFFWDLYRYLKKDGVIWDIDLIGSTGRTEFQKVPPTWSVFFGSIFFFWLDSHRCSVFLNTCVILPRKRSLGSIKQCSCVRTLGLCPDNIWKNSQVSMHYWAMFSHKNIRSQEVRHPGRGQPSDSVWVSTYLL